MEALAICKVVRNYRTKSQEKMVIQRVKLANVGYFSSRAIFNSG